MLLGAFLWLTCLMGGVGGVLGGSWGGLDTASAWVELIVLIGELDILRFHVNSRGDKPK